MRKFLNPPFLSKTFGIDKRSLALFRVCLGLLFVYDWFIRVSDLRKYYTDEGVLPRTTMLLNTNPSPWYIQLHLMSGLAGVQYVLFGIALVSALLMVVGYKTRAATIVTWVLLVSVQNRNGLILHGGDVAFRLAFFWGMFLPMGARYSLDSIRLAFARGAEDAAPERLGAPGTSVLHTRAVAEANSESRTTDPRVLSFASAGALLQVCFIYWFTALLKSDASWHNGTAIYYSLSFDQLARPFGLYLLQWPNVLRELTFATYSLERLGPIFALCPFWYSRIRAATAISFILFHFTLGFCFFLGIFTFSCAVQWLLFLPTELWDSLGTWYNAKPRVKLKGLVEKIRGYAHRVGGTLADVRGPALQPPPPVLGALRIMGRWGVQGLAAFFVVYILLWNLRTTDYKRYGTVLPSSMNWIGNITRTDQRWAMFAPPPMETDGWFVIPAVLNNGLEVDLFNNGALVQWEKPAVVAYTNKSERDQKYMINLYSDSSDTIRHFYADYLSREWNKRHIETMQVKSIQIFFMNEKTRKDFRPSKPLRKLLGTYVYGGLNSMPAGMSGDDVFDPTTVAPTRVQPSKAVPPSDAPQIVMPKPQ